MPLGYNFYLETSTSMLPYVAPPNTRFRNAVNQLQVFLNTRKGRQSFSIREIANIPYDVYPNATDAQVAQYFANLTPEAIGKRLRAAGANGATSDLSQIIATVLEKTGNTDVSALISDFVVDTKSTGNDLNSQQSHIQTIVNRRLAKTPLAALILRDTTEFRNGAYYPPNGGKEAISGYRPYFILLVGPPTAISTIAAELESRAPFFAQSVLLGPPAPTPAATLLPPLGGLDYYAADPESAKNLTAKKARLGGPGKNFVLRLEADLSNVIATEDYKRNVENYEVSPAQYSLQVTAQPHGRYTHVFTLTSPTLGAGHTVSIKLKNQLPSWVGQYGTTYAGPLKAKFPEMSRTYGLQYLIRGFAEGLNPTPYLATFQPVTVSR